MPVIGCSNFFLVCVQVLRGGEAVGRKISLERAWDRTSAQRILSKKVELPAPLIDQAPTVTKMILNC